MTHLGVRAPRASRRSADCAGPSRWPSPQGRGTGTRIEAIAGLARSAQGSANSTSSSPSGACGPSVRTAATTRGSRLAEHEARFQTPFHSLISSEKVASAGAPSSTGRRPPEPNATAARACAAGFDGEADVLAFAHRPAVAKRRVGDEQRHAGIAPPERRERSAAPRRASSRAHRLRRRRPRARPTPCPAG